MRFFTSDTHFGHANIIKYSNRPFKDRHEMNEALIENWNAVVGEDDDVFHLGDVALGPWEEWDEVISRLNGNLHLSIGNHDRLFKPGYNEKHRERFRPLYEKWFPGGIKEHWTNFALDDGDLIVNLSHFPYDADHTDKARYMESRLEDRGTILIHGHTHLDQIVSYSAAGTLQIHVGQDAFNYTPVSEDQIVALIKSIEFP
jgi:calcineurin-like phosphoesterase family protein